MRSPNWTTRSLRPLRVDGDELVIVPTGVLHNLPWGGLPSLTEQPHSIASSATRWTPPVGLPVRPQVVVIAGPRLDDGPGEVDAVRSTFTGARTLVGSDATVAAALDLLATADIAHVACHGHFRSDSPMFSSLELVDGPLTVYDLESLGAAPRVVVLPACNAGIAAVSVGDELIGTASALLGIGVGHVVAAGDDRQRPRHGRRDAIVPPPSARQGGSGRGARPHADGGRSVGRQSARPVPRRCRCSASSDPLRSFRTRPRTNGGGERVAAVPAPARPERFEAGEQFLAVPVLVAGAADDVHVLGRRVGERPGRVQ